MKGLKELKQLDRDRLTALMQQELPAIRKELGLTPEALAERSGIPAARLEAAESGGESLLWNEFLTLLFLFWRNDRSRSLVERRNLFPAKLREVLSINRNQHKPTPL